MLPQTPLIFQYKLKFGKIDVSITKCLVKEISSHKAFVFIFYYIIVYLHVEGGEGQLERFQFADLFL